MSRNKFEEECSGCRPAILDMRTGKALPDDSPQMKIVLSVWEHTTREEREAFHDVTCLNSRKPEDLDIMKVITAKIQAAFEFEKERGEK